MERVTLSENLEISKIVHGHWRLVEWNLSKLELLKLTKQNIDLGITTFDHADIYGNYNCEELFGDAIKLENGIRNNIELITKCGIKLISDKFPSRKTKSYDYSFKHIISSVENSLKNFNTDYIDMLLLHRPSPFFNPNEVAEAFSKLKKEGKVLNFGVSNFNPQQFDMLNSFVEEPLVTNQIEISPFCLEHFQNGNMDSLITNKIKPMAWSPLGGGSILNPSCSKGEKLLDSINEVAEELNVTKLDSLIYSWLLNHPASIIPVVGTSKIDRIKNAIESTQIKISAEQWQKIYVASLGEELP